MKANKKLTRIASLALMATLTATVAAPEFIASAADLSTNGRYYSEFTSREMAEEAGRKFNKELASEGMVLLKNDGTLPVAAGAKVSVLGVAQDSLLETEGSITDSLKNAGYKINPTLEQVYSKDGKPAYGTELALSNTAKQSLDLYGDLAVIVLARGTSGESGDRDLAIDEVDNETYLGADSGWEHEAHQKDEEGNAYKHELQLTDSEQELIKLAEEKCDKVVVLYSASYTFECADLEKDKNINAIMWIGRLGDGGIAAVGEALTGVINPSGKTVDVWTRDFTNDPTYANAFPSDYVVNGENGLEASEYYGLDYEEDIYLGYKYYETYWYEAGKGNASPKIMGEAATADEWYDYNVVYPLGHGLSYTDFSFANVGIYSDAACKTAVPATVEADTLASAVGNEADIETLYAKVTVTNKGDVAGKEVVQVYIEAPYIQGGIEKSFVTLVGYAKTSKLAPGKSEEVIVPFNVQDMASYDTDTGAYVLDEGEYTVHVMSNSHVDETSETYGNAAFTLNGRAIQKLDDFSGNEIGNLFSGDDDYNSMKVSTAIGSMTEETLLSRADMDDTKPTAPAGDLIFSEELITKLNSYDYLDAETYDDTGKPWEKTAADIPEGWTQATGVADETTGMYDIILDDMAGVPLDDPKWTQFINQFTWEEIASVLNNGYHLTVALPTVGKLQTMDENGPNYTYNSLTWCGAPTVAATWNQELCEEYGKYIGNMALWQNMTGWYGPGANIHRSQFSGRSPEYYSQDALQGGYIAAAVIRGAQSKGINVYVKHYAMYDVSGMDGMANASEQCMRENYLKIFQMAYQEGGATASMSSFARIGIIFAAQNYNLIQGLARDEWGWTGFMVTDIYSHMPYMSIDGLVRAGAEIPDGDLSTAETKNLSGVWDATKKCVVVNEEADYTQWYCARQSFTRVLYNAANSAGNHNGVTDTATAVSIKGKQSVAMSESVLPEKYLDPNAGYEISYSVTKGTLPVGLTIENGLLVGTPKESGTFSATLNVMIDQWIPIVLTLNIEVESCIQLEQDISVLTTGDEIDVYVEPDFSATEYTSSFEVSLANGVLPTGLSISQDGQITGTATEAGDYTFTLAIKAINYNRYVFAPGVMQVYIDFLTEMAGGNESMGAYLAVQMGMASWAVYANETYYFTYTTTVTGEAVDTPIETPSYLTADEVKALISEAIDGIELPDATSASFKVEEGYIKYSTDNGETWTNLIAMEALKGDKGEAGAPGQDGAPGKDGEGFSLASLGCSSVVATSSVAVITLMGAAVLVLKKRD